MYPVQQLHGLDCGHFCGGGVRGCTSRACSCDAPPIAMVKEIAANFFTVFVLCLEFLRAVATCRRKYHARVSVIMSRGTQ